MGQTNELEINRSLLPDRLGQRLPFGEMGCRFRHETLDLDGITAIGVDEVSYSKGHKYMTLVYQTDSGRKRLLGVIRDRDTQSLASFFESFGVERCAKIKVVCSDMWKI